MKRVLQFMIKVQEVLAMSGIAVFTLAIFLGAVTRIFRHPLNILSTIALFAFIWTAFLCANVAFQRGRLVNVDLLVTRFPLKVQKAIAVLVYAIIIVFIVMLIYFGIQVCRTTGYRHFNGQTGFSYFWAALSVPVCFSLMLITAIERLAKLLKSSGDINIAKM